MTGIDERDAPDVPGADIGMAAGKPLWMGTGPLGWWRPYWSGTSVGFAFLMAFVCILVGMLAGLLLWYFSGGKAVW
jgi:hypothetical protein